MTPPNQTWLICGGRAFTKQPEAFAWLDNVASLHGTPTLIIQGGARGADHIAHEWGRARNIPVRTYPADWNQHGRSAGFIRNQQMLDEGKPCLVLALPGGRGTAHMTRIPRAAGIPVIEAVIP